MKIPKLIVAYPGGNTTALIFGRRPAMDRKELNEQIISAWQKQYPDLPQIEQCCFVKKSAGPVIGTLEMLGGEFCGNATRSAVWILQKGKNSSGLIKASGSPQPLSFSINNGEVALKMPGSQVKTVKEGILVQFAGITQLVVSDSQYLFGGEENLLRGLLSSNAYGLKKCAAVGVTSINENANEARFSIWVKAVDTVFNETACGSGTCAIGISKAIEIGAAVSLSITQPSGRTIAVTAEPQGRGQPSIATIAGTIDIIYDGAFSTTANTL